MAFSDTSLLLRIRHNYAQLTLLALAMRARVNRRCALFYLPAPFHELFMVILVTNRLIPY